MPTVQREKLGLAMPDFADKPAKVADFCRLVGIGRQRVTTLRTNGQITGATLGEWVRSYCENLREAAAGRSNGDGPLNLAQERAALAQAQRRRLEREERVAAGELINRARALESYCRAARTIRDGVLSVPARISVMLVGVDDERDIDRMLTDALREELHRVARMGAGDE